MPKERSMNPAAAQHKLDKQKSMKKGKADALARRNEKLARRNPDRIQRQINELKQMQESGQKLRPREQQILEALEKDLRAVQKAREALGDKAPKFNERGGDGARGPGDGVLGKRRRGGDRDNRFGQESDSSETDEEVRRIPMPRDTPPPIPRQYQKRDSGPAEGVRGPHTLPNKPPVTESKTVYEAKPDIKDLRREAISKFVPAAVRVKQESIRGQGKLLEPEEMDKLEKAGYQAGPAEGQPTGNPDDDEERRRLLEEEERRFNQELRSVQIEEVEDEEA
ncbi:WW domain binding protein 11 [Aspergillus ruber CBS 135680]|uniref:Wbp11/ELF5/Saf1 N-terminal domain-containing protein n=1 Tax=Aspergillus ruber (strain CBS 135680) TaxID=1388766 RepID=A0A017SJ56_ASPRC|nr:uncharacterized protein EURHEDRAFT_410759 [Aspergillus ruber CBS 135680]EYE96962.1 hypothetical protein EURHEDRAFT_410759 [Aspergillus ruber CBS 135680]